jgi:DNA-binding response OmpR family regulator
MLKRILVLDDSQDILDIVKETLSYEHFEVKVTPSSDHITDTLQTYLPDLVILDYKQTGPKGDDICRDIKAHPYLNNTPVIICSAYLANNDLSDCGCDATIAKPFGLAELLDKVKGLLHRNRALSTRAWAHIETF